MDGIIIEYVKCSDGWNSPSPGGRGTCSWHGGIAHPEVPGWATPVMIIIVLVILLIILICWANDSK